MSSFQVLDTGVVPADYAVDDAPRFAWAAGVFGLDRDRFFKEFDRSVVLRPASPQAKARVHQMWVCAGAVTCVGSSQEKSDRLGKLPCMAVCPAQTKP